MRRTISTKQPAKTEKIPFKEGLKKFGDSIVIDKGLNNISKLHVHTNAPDALLEKASELGVVENVSIDDIAEQVKNK